MLQAGDKMPSFAAADETGKMVTDKDLIGKKTVIYFYPKDSTPGCTAEACNIRDNYHAFLAQGYQVFGVSKDSQASHIKFKEKYDLPFPLLSDPTTEMLQAFGAGDNFNAGYIYAKLRGIDDQSYRIAMAQRWSQNVCQQIGNNISDELIAQLKG